MNCIGTVAIVWRGDCSAPRFLIIFYLLYNSAISFILYAAQSLFPVQDWRFVTQKIRTLGVPAGIRLLLTVVIENLALCTWLVPRANRPNPLQPFFQRTSVVLSYYTPRGAFVKDQNLKKFESLSRPASRVPVYHISSRLQAPLDEIHEKRKIKYGANVDK